jgi:hypothetical protein
MFETVLIIRRNFSTDFKKNTQFKFHEIPSSGSRDVLRGRTDGQTDGYDKGNDKFAILRTRSNRSKREAVLNVEFNEIH